MVSGAVEARLMSGQLSRCYCEASGVVATVWSVKSVSGLLCGQ